MKVGCTANPGHRLAAHRASAAGFGVAIVDVWVSPVHDNYTRTEQDLIALAAQLSDSQRLAEYFVGVDFAELVKQAALLDFPPVDRARHEAIEARNIRVRRQLTKVLLRGHEPMNESWNDAAHRVIGGLLGRLADGTYSHGTLTNEGNSPELRVLVQRIADLKGVPSTAVLEMNFVDVLRGLLETIVHTEALQLEIWACRAGRHDLLQPVWRSPEPVDPPAA